MTDKWLESLFECYETYITFKLLMTIDKSITIPRIGACSGSKWKEVILWKKYILH